MTDANDTPSMFRRLWLVVLLTCLLLTFPVALAILASGPVYKKVGDGYAPITKGTRFTYAGFLALWLVALAAKAVIHSGEPQPSAPTIAVASSPEGNIPASAGPTEGQTPAAPAAASAVPVPACTDPKVRRMAMDGMQVAFDKMGMPFEPTMKTALGSLEEKDSDEAARLKRILTNPTDGHFKPDEVRMCEGTGRDMDYLGMTAVIQHDGKLGGYVLISGLRTPIPFGQPLD